ncbi:RNA polymerase sigma factor [Flagellimonas algicola]|uniref:RNA polymerase sigma factor n=1 Tax=Flagellimonas algicola TaxID=2583815 RepID=A0ABY2WIF5_9FLAO|nr:RNA polymerase sigma factor [Allomuricauda algicola]TMU54628.1 RNA polymerase sigma factor [Allomuricauda algicola]
MNTPEQSVCDEKVYNTIFERYSESLRNYMYYQCKDLDQAEDLTQEAFIKLWQHCAKVLFEKAKAFLFTVAKNKFYNQVAHKKVVLDYANSKPHKTADHESPEFLLEEDEFMKKLQSAIDALPDGQREVFLLNRIDKKTYKEMAQMLGVSETAIEKRMQKALLKLRAIIKEI